MRAGRAEPDASRPRVGFLIDRWQPGRGGAEAALALLATHLSAKGHEVHAFGVHGPRPEEASIAQFHPVRTRGVSRGARERSLARALDAAAREVECDVTIGIRHLERVDLYWPHGGSHLATLEAYARARGRPPGKLDLRGRHQTFVELEGELLAEGGARLVACPSALVRDELTRLYPACAPRLVLCPNGVDLDRFHPRERATRGAALRAAHRIRDDEVLLVFAARHPRFKGLIELFDALAELRELPWRLLVAGPARPKRWQRAASRAGLAERVRFSADEDPVALAAGADLGVLPTWRDTSGLVVLEALAAGTPVVTTRFAGAADAVTSEVAGEVVDTPSDRAALRDALARGIERAQSGFDRDAVRAHVLSRGVEEWLAGLTDLVEKLHREGPVRRME